MIFIKYKGEIQVNQYGISYEYPHFSTILGSLLAVFHRSRGRTLFGPDGRKNRICMLEQANELGIRLTFGFRDAFCFYEENILLSYVDKKEERRGVGKNHYSYGDYFIGVSSKNEEFLEILRNYPIKIGGNNGSCERYDIISLEDAKEMWEHYYFFKERNESILNEASYSLEIFNNPGMANLCLVSQVKNKGEILQGKYKDFYVDSPASFEEIRWVDYQNNFKEIFTRDLYD